MDEEERFCYLKSLWAESGLTQDEKEEFSALITKRVEDQERTTKARISSRLYDLHHSFSRDNRDHNYH